MYFTLQEKQMDKIGLFGVGDKHIPDEGLWISGPA